MMKSAEKAGMEDDFEGEPSKFDLWLEKHLGEHMMKIVGVVAMVFGVALALAQQHFGFLKLSGETFLIDAYPVEVHPSDLAWVIVTFVSVSYLISVLTVRAMIPKKEISQNRP